MVFYGTRTMELKWFVWVNFNDDEHLLILHFHNYIFKCNTITPAVLLRELMSELLSTSTPFLHPLQLNKVVV